MLVAKIKLMWCIGYNMYKAYTVFGCKIKHAYAVYCIGYNISLCVDCKIKHMQCIGYNIKLLQCFDCKIKLMRCIGCTLYNKAYAVC